MGSFMGKTKIYYEFKRKNVDCYSCPAYRVTPHINERGGTKSRLVSLFLLESFLTKLISNLPIKTGK
jgi:hypothetical protein